MRLKLLPLAFCCALAGAVSAHAASGKVIKVLPQFLDVHGQQTLSPSLYERDAYQAFLRLHPDQISGMRFNVQWKAKGAPKDKLILRVELRGTAHGDLASSAVIDRDLKPGGWFSHWTAFTIPPESFHKLESVTAWRATLWDGATLLGEQKSFLW